MSALKEAGFSPRQMAVLSGIAKGQSNKEIARDLGLNEDTVKDHARMVMARCGAKNRTQAAVWAVRRGLA